MVKLTTKLKIAITLFWSVLLVVFFLLLVKGILTYIDQLLMASPL